MADIDLAALRRIGQGRAAEVFALDDQRVIKAARTEHDESIAREAAAMRAAHAAGMPVPAVHELVRVAGRPAVIMSRAAGVDMLSALGRRPWLLVRTGPKLGRLHARLHETVAPLELPSVRSIVEQRAASIDDEPARAKVLRTLAELPDGDRLCHLDFHPGNVIRNGPEMVVIDWPGAARGEPLADVALTALGLLGGKPPPGTSLLTRTFEPLGRKLILRGYLRGYGKAKPIDSAALARWLVVAAGVRLSYGIAGERDTMLRAIERDGRVL